MLPIQLQHVPACQPAVGFIVNPPFEAFQAGEDRQWLDVKYRILPVSLWQVVVGDLCAQVMDVMEADIPGEPLQQDRKSVV